MGITDDAEDNSVNEEGGSCLELFVKKGMNKAAVNSRRFSEVAIRNSLSDVPRGSHLVGQHIVASESCGKRNCRCRVVDEYNARKVLS